MKKYISAASGIQFLWRAFVLFAVLVAGCAVATHPGLVLPKEQIAALYSTEDVHITRVDGIEKKSVFGLNYKDLIPGGHRISMKIGPPSYRKHVDLKFDAIAGHEYEAVRWFSGIGGNFVDMTLIGFEPWRMWEAAILDRKTRETVAESGRVNDKKSTVVTEPTPTLLLQDSRVEVLLEKWGKTESFLFETGKEFVPPSSGDIFFAIRATITKIKGVALRDFGCRDNDLSLLRDDKGNTYKLHYWSTKGGYTTMQRLYVFREGAPISLNFIIPKDATPTHLTLVYYYLDTKNMFLKFARLQQGIIEIDLSSVEQGSNVLSEYSQESIPSKVFPSKRNLTSKTVSVPIEYDAGFGVNFDIKVAINHDEKSLLKPGARIIKKLTIAKHTITIIDPKKGLFGLPNWNDYDLELDLESVPNPKVIIEARNRLVSFALAVKIVTNGSEVERYKINLR